MPCYSPVLAHKTETGDVTFSAKGQIGGGLAPFKLPCGQCIGCRLTKKRNWAIRCMHEAQMHEENAFITLTYEDNHLPADRGLRLEHWQKFAKRLRKRIGPFRFFHCGEYGTKNLRPHYHALIFGESFGKDSVPLERSPFQTSAPQHQLRVSPLLQETWPYGFHTVGAVTFDSAAYCASYTTKKINGPGERFVNERCDPDTGEVFDVRPEYATMSRRPGIGASWFEKYVDDVYPSNQIIMKGQPFPPPPYYDNLLKQSDPELLEEMKHQRYLQLEGQQWNQTPARLNTRARVQTAKHAQSEDSTL